MRGRGDVFEETTAEGNGGSEGGREKEKKHSETMLSEVRQGVGWGVRWGGWGY